MVIDEKMKKMTIGGTQVDLLKFQFFAYNCVTLSSSDLERRCSSAKNQKRLFKCNENINEKFLVNRRSIK